MLGRRRWPEVAHVDLLAPARRVWSAVLGDCRLSTLERDVLGIVREEDVPGWEIPARFFAYLRDRQPRRLQPVFAHNRDDVLSLVALLGWFTETLVGELPGLAPRSWRASAASGSGWMPGAAPPITMRRSTPALAAPSPTGCD